MEECLCGEKAVYVCKPCKAMFCKVHRIVHEEGKQRVHIFEKIGKKLASKLRIIIMNDLASKIQLTDKCEKMLIDETKRIIAKIQEIHIHALSIIKQKQQRYTMLFIDCQKRLRCDKLKEIEQELLSSLIIEKPSPHSCEEFSTFYNLEFLQVTDKIGKISSMPIADAKCFLAEFYGLFLETHTDPVDSMAITPDNTHLVSVSFSSIRI